LNDLMTDFDEPGQFVTIYGYEWSGNTALGGDRNVFFREPHRPIRRSSHALVSDRGDLASDCEDAAELFRKLNRDGEDAVCWAHCGGRYADIAYAHDVRLERSVEVHSSWGTFEWLLADAFAGGHRVGIVANSDGHKGRPGSEPPGASMFGALGGLTCFLAEGFDQDGVFDAMKARHHYGTTGCRLDLNVQAALPQPGMLYRDDPSLPEASARPASRAIMGDIVRTSAGTLHLSVEIAAASPILLLEIRNAMQTIATIRPYEDASPGRRLFLFWSGAEYRGRGRQTVWDGTLKISDNEILSARPINFFNPDKQLDLTADSVSWRSVTTGNFAGCELQLASEAGRIVVETPHGAMDAEIATLGFEPLTVECGGLERRLSLVRLPDRNPHRSLRIDREIALDLDCEHALMVAVTLEDGHRAWSSPIYLVR
jgi:hypothetical protein